MCAKNHLLIFSSFLDIWENVEWPRFFGPPGISVNFVSLLFLCWWNTLKRRVLYKKRRILLRKKFDASIQFCIQNWAE